MRKDILYQAIYTKIGEVSKANNINLSKEDIEAITNEIWSEYPFNSICVNYTTRYCDK